MSQVLILQSTWGYRTHVRPTTLHGFLAETSDESGIAELKDYVSGAKQVPVPTYFLCGGGRGAELALPALEDPESKADIHHLGKAGLRTVQGLSVAFLDHGAGAVRQPEAWLAMLPQPVSGS